MKYIHLKKDRGSIFLPLQKQLILILTVVIFKLFPNWAFPSVAAFIVMVVLNVGCDSSVIPDVSSDQEITSIHHTIAIELPEIVNDRLYFEDFEDFRSYLTGIVRVDTLSGGPLPSFPGFRSLLEHTERLILRAEDVLETGDLNSKFPATSEFEIVEDPYLASVLNVDGELQIGDNVFKFARNYV